MRKQPVGEFLMRLFLRHLFSLKITFIFSIPLLFVLSGCLRSKGDGQGGQEVRVLTYRSLASQDGFLEKVRPLFEAKSGCRLKVETVLGAMQFKTHLAERPDDQRFDVVVGMELATFEENSGYFFNGDFDLKPLVPVIKSMNLPRGFIPFDYSYLGFIYDKRVTEEKSLPKSLKDFETKTFHRKFIVQDPRASSPGLQFLYFSEGWIALSKLKSQWLALAPSWESSYQMFLKKEAPFVWSYYTSLAYHRSQGEGESFGVVSLDEGAPVQVEGFAVVNRPGNPLTTHHCLKEFVDFMLSSLAQKAIPESQWMLPVVEKVELPLSFQNLPMPKKSPRKVLGQSERDVLLGRFSKSIFSHHDSQ